VAVLTLLTRAYCHLCDEMRDALSPIATRHGVAVVEIDVDAHPDLEAALGERVPVLVLGSPLDGIELCHFHLDADGVEAALAKLAQ
jgi:glutaredoxin